jgi:uncharacterized membrane protein AbrB (regulator of aidB expression)
LRYLWIISAVFLTASLNLISRKIGRRLRLSAGALLASFLLILHPLKTGQFSVETILPAVVVFVATTLILYETR